MKEILSINSGRHASDQDGSNASESLVLLPKASSHLGNQKISAESDSCQPQRLRCCAVSTVVISVVTAGVGGWSVAAGHSAAATIKASSGAFCGSVVAVAACIGGWSVAAGQSDATTVKDSCGTFFGCACFFVQPAKGYYEDYELDSVAMSSPRYDASSYVATS